MYYWYAPIEPKTPAVTMLRRLTNICLLPLLLIPSVSAKHWHGSGESAGHDLCPHFHSTYAHDSHSHDHGEHTTAGHSHGDFDHRDPPEISAPPQSADDFDPIAEHDRDAIFLNANASEFATVRVADVVDSNSLVDCANRVESTFCGIHPNPARGSLRAHRPPFNSGYACPVFLRQLSLLI